MTYMVGDIIEEVEAGGPVSRFPKSFRGPPMHERDRKAIEQGEQRSKLLEDSQETEVQEPQEDWVRKKWDHYFNPNKDGVFKPQLTKMSNFKLRKFIKDMELQERNRANAVYWQEEDRDFPIKPEAKLEVKSSGSLKRKLATSPAEVQGVGIDDQQRPRKKSLTKAAFSKEEYLKKRR